MHVVLVNGLWLDISVWDQTMAHLFSTLRIPVSPVELPIRTSEGAAASLNDQLDTVLASIDSQSEPALVVGHSAAATLAWLAADRRPGHVAGTVLVGGFPQSDGEQYASFFPIVAGVMNFPGWQAFEGPDSADMTEEQKKAIEARAVPVPEAVAHGVVNYTTEARFSIPTVLICPEYSPADAQRWIDHGDIPELAKAQNVTYEDVDSGHWPMVTRPDELAEIIERYAR